MVRPRRSPPPRTAPRQSRALVLALLGIALVATLVIVAWKAGNANKQAIVGLRSSRSTTAAKPSAAAAATRRVARLEITDARGSSWLQVRRGSLGGPLVFQGTLDKGSRHVFTAKRLWLDMAKPDALSAKLNGVAVRLPGAKTVVVTARGVRPSSGA